MSVPTEKQVTQWLLDADQHKGELKKVGAAYRRQEREEKNLAFVRKKLDGQTDKLAGGTNKLTRATGKLHGAMKVAGGIVMAAGLAKLSQAMGSVIRTALDFEDWIGKDTAALDGMRTATAGMISDLDLAKARTRLTTGDYKLQEEQLKAVAVAAIHLTRINKTSFSQSLDQVTKSIKTGSSKAMKELGFNVDLLGKSTDKTSLAIKLITERFGGTTVKAANTNEQIDQMKNSFEKASAEMGQAILESGALQTALEGLTVVAKNFASIMGVVEKALYFFPLLGVPLLISKVVENEADEGYAKASKKLKDTMKAYRKIKDFTDQWDNRTSTKEAAAAEAKTAFSSPLFSFNAEGVFTGEEIKIKKAAKKAGKKAGKAFTEEFTKAFDPATAFLSKMGSAMQAASTQLEQFTATGRLKALLGNKLSAGLDFLRSTSGPAETETPELDQQAAAAAAMAAKAGAQLSKGPSSKWAAESVLIADTRYELEQLIAAQERLNGLIARGDQGTPAHREAVDALSEHSEALSKASQNLAEYQSVTTDAGDTIGDMATGALSSFTSGLWAAADAAIQGGDSMGLAVAKMVKSVLLGVATQATVKAIFSLAEGFAAMGSLNPASAAAHFTAAGMYAAVAVIAGAGGLAVSAGISGSTGSSGSPSASKATSNTAATPTYGTSVKDEKDINVNVYLGDPTDPGTVLMMEKQVRAMVA